MQRIDRRSFLRTVGLGAAALAVPRNLAAARQANAKPNIILIMADDLGYEALSCYGSLTYKTPVLDELAKTGMRFDHCHAQPLCTPSRVQIMTGMYNFRNYTRFGHLDTGQTTFANLLRKAGYATAIAGKWQLGGDGKTVQHFGFDEHCLWYVKGGRAGRYWNARLIHDDKVTVHPKDTYGPDILCEFITDFIQRKKDGPFFVYYPMVLTHWPFDPTPDSPDGGSKKKHVAYKDSGRVSKEYFKDMVAYMDKIIGRIVKKLEALGLRENTLILFTADNGTACKIRGKMGDGTTAGGGKGLMTDDGTRVPLVASWPAAIPPGRTSEALVDFTDLLPTLTQATGVELPADLKIDGKSFLPVLLGKKEHVREWIYCHYHPHPRPATLAAEAKAKYLAQVRRSRAQRRVGRWARTQKYKLYDTGAFFDVSEDVLEKRPIPPGKGTGEAEAARKLLRKAHDSMPPWSPFAWSPPKKRPLTRPGTATAPQG